jgi:trans-2,3-dihydro-3-hydroxyanthranilate isomerase|tara:strand:- start:246 stop:1160 length:915 start_codon:yes stop_codon:yes gene_type:complete
MNTTYYTLDVFTKTAFQGAQIAVFPFAENLSDELLPLIAKELNLSETVFIYPSEEGGSTFNIRIFSPRGEVGFAGHPILATAHVLAETGQLLIQGDYTSITLNEKSKTIVANISLHGSANKFVQFTLQCHPEVDRFTPPTEELARFLSIDESDIDQAHFHTRLVSEGLPYLVVPLLSQSAVRRAQFDIKAWSESSAPEMAAQEILLFSAKTNSSDSNFHGRLVGPSIGFNEDPPIGSAMPAFCGYLASHDHIRKGTYSFAIDRGTVVMRRSLLHIEMDKRAGWPLTLRVGGDSVLVSKNELLVN